jgi:hypothetical protein
MNRPQAGEFYRHYKYDPAGPEANFTYIIIGTGLHTEDRYETVIYQPLHSEVGFLGACNFCVRPYDMFVGTVTVNGSEVPRFVRITDEAELETLRVLHKKLQ